MRPARHSASRVGAGGSAPVPATGRRRLPAQAAMRRQIGSASLGKRARLVVGAMRELRAAAGPSRGRRRRRWCPARTPQAMGKAHPLDESGGRQRLLERRQRRSQERPGASLLSRDAKRRRGRATAVALATAKARTLPAKRRRLIEAAAAPASPRCRPWRARSPTRSAGPGGRARGAAGSAAR